MPATITALREHPRKPGRYEIELAGGAELADNAEFDSNAERRGGPTRLPVSVELIAALKLKPGRELTASELTQLQTAARAIACYDKALATLGARARSSADLARYLRSKEFTDAEIAPTIEKLQSLGLLDDREYARSFARSRLAPSRGFGPRRVAMELARKGVSRSIVDQVLAEHEAERREASDNDDASNPSSPNDPVLEAARKKLRTMSKLEPDVRRRRLYGYLARRGFGGADITRALGLIERGLTEAGAEMEIGE